MTVLESIEKLAREALGRRSQANGSYDGSCVPALAKAVLELSEKLRQVTIDFEEVNDGLHKARAAINAQHEDVVHDIRDLIEDRDHWRARAEAAEDKLK